MRASALLAPTLRQVPAEAEVISHQLMLRAGMIRKTAAGMYTYMPLAQRVMLKIQAIIREEMERIGAQEVMLPIIQPAELWQESGRWGVYGAEMFRLQDRHGRHFCLGPTHEEVITDLVRSTVNSYRQLPQLLYQIQNKYRDERRPRFGLMRGREFVMQDLYSFDRDEEGMRQTYEQVRGAYQRIFQRCGLDFREVEADTGAIGGSASNEFMVLAAAGEASVLFCAGCAYGANAEKATSPVGLPPDQEQSNAAPELVATPAARSVAEVSSFLGIPPRQILKTLYWQADGQPVAVVLRGDRELNETKLQHVLNCQEMQLADEELVRSWTGAEPGSVGPLGLQGITLLADSEVELMVDAVCGANRDGFHYRHINPGRDFRPERYLDLRLVQRGDPCPVCGASLEEARGIEVGQVFQLGLKYSQALQAKYTDERGEEQLMVMGCYGIGVGRTMAAAVEQNHDDDGICWPEALAPYQVVIVPVSGKEDQLQVAEAIYQQLQGAGLEVVLDDRPERAGVKFKDADLIGFPVRVTVGQRTVTEGTVEIRRRKNREEIIAPLNQVLTTVQKWL